MLKNIVGPIILKLDVQGLELEVLKGAKHLLSKVDYIVAEVSFIDTYKDQVNANSIIEYLETKFFEIKKKCNLNKINGKPFQEDVLFIKKN